MNTDAPSRYDYEFDPDDETSTAARICALVGRDREVLELGCAAGAMTAVLTRHYGCRVTGVEYDPVAAEAARPHAREVLVASLEDPDWAKPLAGRRFDTVLAADVLEHLHDPAACVRQLRDLLSDDGRLVVSVPNLAHGGVIASLLCGEFDYCDVGLLDRTHVHFFTPSSLGRLLHENGFAVEAQTAALAGAWHPEFSAYWKRLPGPLAGWLEKGPSSAVYQAILVARRSEAPGPYRDDDAGHAAWLAELPLFPGAAEAVEAAMAEATEARRALADAQAAQAAADGRVAELQAALDQRDDELARMRASLSWGVTRPLRALARLARGGRDKG